MHIKGIIRQLINFFSVFIYELYLCNNTVHTPQLQITLPRNETFGSQRVNSRSTMRALLVRLHHSFFVIWLYRSKSGCRKIPTFTSSSTERGFSDGTQLIGPKERNEMYFDVSRSPIDRHYHDYDCKRIVRTVYMKCTLAKL